MTAKKALMESQDTSKKHASVVADIIKE